MNNADPRSASTGLRSIKAELSAASQRIARSEAELLLAHLLGRDRGWLFAWPEHQLSDEQIRAFRDRVERRAAGRPVAQLIGQRAFWTLDLEVSADTLIPRPETELLVEWALELGGTGPRKVLDLGTGTGAIALALASERPHWRIDAIDCSAATLAVARRNADRLALKQVQWLESDWFEAIPPERRYDLIVANPPYVAANDPHLERGDLRFEPRAALAAGTDGLDDIRRIVVRALEFLEPGGRLLLEHGYDQGTAVRKLLAAAGYQQVTTHLDLAGLERITVATQPQSEFKSGTRP